MKVDAYRVIKHLSVSEKGTALAETGKYVFRVDRDAGKRQIRQAVEHIYRVHVQKVNVMTTPPKRRKVRIAVAGLRARYKKAIVTLREGDKIATT